MTAALEGRRVLVVEDESLVAMLIETILVDLGCEVVGPVANLDEAVALIRSDARIDLALLDVNVAGQPVFPAAEALEARGTPFVFAWGYGAGGLPDRWRDRPTLQKPFTEPAIGQALMQAMGAARV